MHLEEEVKDLNYYYNEYVFNSKRWSISFKYGLKNHTETEFQEERVDLIDLHPTVFRTTPRLDLLHRNVNWQLVYRNVQLTKQLSKAEMPGGGRKPWPQKKTGRHHAGSIRAPGFIRGG